MNQKERFEERILKYLGGKEKINIIEMRPDPVISHSTAVRTEKNGCFIMHDYDNSVSVWEEFELDKENGEETLQDLNVGSPRFW